MTAALIIAKDSLLLDQTKPVGTKTLKTQVCVEPCTAGCIVNAGCHHSSDVGRHQSISAANQLMSLLLSIAVRQTDGRTASKSLLNKTASSSSCRLHVDNTDTTIFRQDVRY